MIDDPLLLELGADALLFPQLSGGVKLHAVRVNFEFADEATAKLRGELFVSKIVYFFHVQDQLIDFERVVLALAQFNLPRPDMRVIVQARARGD